PPAGDASLQNALDLSVSLLRSLPPYGHREVLVLFAALATCDPGSVLDSMKACKDNNIRVSVVGVAAEVYVCRRVTEVTGGSYGVALNEAHLEQLLLAHSTPPPATAVQARAELVRMGFPQRSTEEASSAVFVGQDVRLLAGSYTCPRCKSRVPELPCECHTCGLTLISSPHLARSYHHLFPVPPYSEDSEERAAEAEVVLRAQPAMREEVTTSTGVYCFGCLREVSRPGATGQLHLTLRCGQCKQVFCFECDAYVHEQLHNCPGCELVAGT
ncbi:General transcription factor IIH subunit 2, partial [Tetrabaena socialis]